MTAPVREHITLEISVPLDGGGTQMHYIATQGFRTGAADTPASTYFAELVDAKGGGVGEYRRDLFSAARVAGASRAGRVVLALINAGGVLDAFHRASPGGQVVARIGVPGSAYPAAYETLFVLYVNTAAADFEHVRLEAGDRMALLDAPILTATFKGTGGLEGTVTAANKKQLVFGSPGMVPLILLDPVKQIYYVQANATDQNTLSGLSEFGHPFEGGVPVERGPLYNYAEELLAVEPDEGQYRLWAGITPPRINNIIFADADATRTYTKGPLYLRLKAPPIFDLRFGASGLLQNTSSETPRAWRFTDMCNRAGLSDVGPGTLAPMAGLTQDFDMGNRLVEGNQTYVDVMSDRAAALLGACGFDRLDRFWCANLTDPEDGADVSAYTFTTDNSRDFARTPVPGMENPVGQISVRAGRAFPSNLASGASTEMQDILSRQEYLISFSGTSDEVLRRYPRALRVTLDVDGHDFATPEAQLAFVQAFGRLHGTPRDFISLTCREFSTATRALDLLSKVTLRINRFGYDAGVLMRVISITHNYADRTIRFGLWGSNGGRYAWALGGGSYPSGSGDPGGSNGGAQPPDSYPNAGKLRDTIDPFTGTFAGTISMAGALESLMEGFAGSYVGSVAAPSGDPDFASVALLAPLTAAGTTIADLSSYASGSTGDATRTISASDTVVGGAGALYITTPDNGGLHFTNASGRFNWTSGEIFTIEGWYKRVANSGSGSASIRPRLCMWPRSENWDVVALCDVPASGVALEGQTTYFAVADAAWHYVCILGMADDTLEFWADGALIDTATPAAHTSPYATLDDFYLAGGYNNTGLDTPAIDCRMGQWRFTRGVHRDPTVVPTAPFPTS